MNLSHIIPPGVCCSVRIDYSCCSMTPLQKTEQAWLLARLAEATTADGPTADELDFAKFGAEFEAKSVVALKELLRLNGQKLFGAKAELVLRCTDAKAYGSLPKCPDCGGGRMEVTYPTRCLPTAF